MKFLINNLKHTPAIPEIKYRIIKITYSEAVRIVDFVNSSKSEVFNKPNNPNKQIAIKMLLAMLQYFTNFKSVLFLIMVYSP